MPTRHVKLVIDSCLDDVFLVGLAVSKFCEYIRLAELESYQVEVSVVEAVTNVIKHAYLGAAGHDVEVSITLESHSIRVEVTDTGSTMAESLLDAAVDGTEDQDFDQLSDSGRGLFIVKNFMDEVQYASENGRNTLSMVKSLVAEVR